METPKIENRCLGITRNLRRCQRVGKWRVFCHDHKRQPIVWFFTGFTLLAAIISIYSSFSSSSEPPSVNVNHGVGAANDINVHDIVIIDNSEKTPK